MNNRATVSTRDQQLAVISDDKVKMLCGVCCDDVFSILGLHKWDDEHYIVRVFIPDADKVELMQPVTEQSICEFQHVKAGIFVAVVETQERFAYRLRVHYGEHREIREDPYRFPSSISTFDLYLFGEGNNERLYDWMGAHLKEVDGVNGTSFCVWAPNAKCVSVVGDFNYWDGRHHMMRKHIPSGVWELFIPGVLTGVRYKYEIKDREGHVLPHKSDPFGFSAELPPQTASKVVETSSYEWGDDNWMRDRSIQSSRDRPISIYEVHLGSWRRKNNDEVEGGEYLSYRDFAHQLVDYVQELGFTHIQLMPVSEFPFNGSWGYQPIGLFAPTSRFGEPQDFMYFVDRCHQAGIGVLVDWVPGHFPSDGHGLARFDGTPLYEHADDRQGFHPDWNTYIYNYGRKEVANFLFANALFWFERFHIDGLRVDAVASMLYLDYSRKADQWIPNCYGGRENLDAIDLLKKVNQKVYERFPDVMMIAEESTAWPGVSHPVHLGGLGFGYKWNMGWMNDSLRYMENDPIHRQYHHHDMTFSLLYAFNENFVLPLSHDEVVHGKSSLLDKMPGDGDQKFANLRAYFAFMWAHPGKKLLFMGGEFAQGAEWNHDASIDWHLLDHYCHKGVQTLVKDLNRLYVTQPSMHQKDCEHSGFEWLEADDSHNSIFAFLRKSEGHPPMLVVSNFTPVDRQNYILGVPFEGYYREILNTSAETYGGSNKGNDGGCQAQCKPSHGREWSLSLTIPGLSTLVFTLD